MSHWKRLLAVLALASLAACGGGGSSSGTPILGGGNGGTAIAEDLSLVLSAASLSNDGGATLTATATAVDKNRNVVQGIPVTFVVDAGATAAPGGTSTNAQGVVSAVIGIGSDRADRLVSVTATSGTLVRTASFRIIGTRIASTLVPAIVAPGAPGEVQYRVIDAAGKPMSGLAVSVSAPGLTAAAGNSTVTGSSGEFKFAYTAPTTTGNYKIAATVGGVTDEQTVGVQGSSSVEPVSAAIVSASVSANPSVVGVNPANATTLNRAEVRALFLTAGNVPVRNVRVRFDLGGDANAVGGTFSTGDNTLYSDANGIVTTAYIPGTRFSPNDGVTVRACYGTTDSDPDLLNCNTSAVVRLTVVSDPLGVSIGTNELIVVNELSYTKRFLVSVANSAGEAKAEIPLSVSLDLPQYRRGRYALNLAGDTWVKIGPLPSGDDAVCLNEDGNRNGVLEAGEDLNGNARLDPGRSDVTVRLLQPRTGADGTAIVEITYAKSFATWVDGWLTVSAGVAGTEGRATYVLAPIPADAATFKNKDVPPAFLISPFGTAGDCTTPP